VVVGGLALLLEAMVGMETGSSGDRKELGGAGSITVFANCVPLIEKDA
jgi:hypothetical protein